MTTTTTSTIREQIEERREVPLSQLRERYAENLRRADDFGTRQWLLLSHSVTHPGVDRTGSFGMSARRWAAELARDVDVYI